MSCSKPLRSELEIASKHHPLKTVTKGLSLWKSLCPTSDGNKTFCVGYRWTDASSPADGTVTVRRTDTTLPSFMTVRRTDIAFPSFMTVPNSHEQVYIKTTPSLILKLKKIFSYIHSFHFIRERHRVLQTIRFNNQQTKCFLIVGRSFHTGRQIAKDSKHHCEGNNCLKEIVSKTRLDLQTGSDFSGFFLQTVLNVHMLLGLLYFTVLKF